MKSRPWDLRADHRAATQPLENQDLKLGPLGKAVVTVRKEKAVQLIETSLLGAGEDMTCVHQHPHKKPATVAHTSDPISDMRLTGQWSIQS